MKEDSTKETGVISATYYMHVRKEGKNSTDFPIACRMYKVFTKSETLKDIVSSGALKEITIQVPSEADMFEIPTTAQFRDEYIREREVGLKRQPVYQFRNVVYNIDSELGDLGWWVSYIDDSHCVWVISLKDWNEQFKAFQYQTC